jgi:hypothetical protein
MENLKPCWKFRIRQCWEILTKGTDTRYEGCLRSLKEEAEQVARMHGLLLRVQKDYQRELTEAKERIRGMVEKASHLAFRHLDGRRFEMTMSFDPNIMSMTSGSRDGMEWVAEMMADQVRREIASCRFIQDAEPSYPRPFPFSSYDPRRSPKPMG